MSSASGSAEPTAPDITTAKMAADTLQQLIKSAIRADRKRRREAKKRLAAKKAAAEKKLADEAEYWRTHPRERHHRRMVQLATGKIESVDHSGDEEWEAAHFARIADRDGGSWGSCGAGLFLSHEDPYTLAKQREKQRFNLASVLLQRGEEPGKIMTLTHLEPEELDRVREYIRSKGGIA